MKQNTVWKYLEANHLFAHSYEQQSLDELRELTVRRIYNIFEKEFVTLADVSVRYKIAIATKKLTKKIISSIFWSRKSPTFL